MTSICLISSRTWPRQANGLQMHSVLKQSSFLWQAYSTISFSYAYFKGFTLGRDKGSSSSPDMALAQIPSRFKSPRSMFIRTVSAISSALCPVTTLQHPNRTAPLSRACLRSTPQYVQLLVCPIVATISSIVHPYSSLQESISNGISSTFWLRLTASSESSRYPLIPSSIANMKNSHPYLYCLFSLLRTWQSTVESLPPLVPMAIRSPGLKSSYLTIVSWISVSKQTKKHCWQIGCWFLGRLIMALAVLQTSHSDFDIVVIFLLYKHPFASIAQQHPLTANQKQHPNLINIIFQS